MMIQITSSKIKSSSTLSLFNLRSRTESLLLLIVLQAILLSQLCHAFGFTYSNAFQHLRSSCSNGGPLSNDDDEKNLNTPLNRSRQNQRTTPFYSITRRRTSVKPIADPSCPIQSRHERLSNAIRTLHAAAAIQNQRPSKEELLSAIIETQQLYGGVGRNSSNNGSSSNEHVFSPSTGFLEALAGGGTPGKRWKLVYVCGKESVIAARKRWKRVAVVADADRNDNGAMPSPLLDPGRFNLARWFPPVLRFGQYVDGFVTAIQRFDLETFENENGIFAIGGSDFVRFTVVGPFKWPGCDEGRPICAFRPIEARVKLGSEWNWKISLSGDSGGGTTPFDDARVTELPFFRFILVDDVVAVAQGRSGSVAMWTRMV